jgi:hypothetical protein
MTLHIDPFDDLAGLFAPNNGAQSRPTRLAWQGVAINTPFIFSGLVARAQQRGKAREIMQQD